MVRVQSDGCDREIVIFVCCMDNAPQPSEARLGPYISRLIVPDSPREPEPTTPELSSATTVRRVNDALAADLQASAAVHSPVPKASAPSGATSEANHVPLSCWCASTSSIWAQSFKHQLIDGNLS